jgi:hypothetical protein
MSLQFGSDGEKVSTALLANKLATTPGVQGVGGHHLIRSSSQSSGGNDFVQIGGVNAIIFSGIQHRLRLW